MCTNGWLGRRRALGIVIALSAGFALAVPAQAWAAKPITVCPTGCDYTDPQDAINAANPGDKITIGPGTYQSMQQSSGPAGFTIAKSITLVGAGAHQTTLSTPSGDFGQVIQINPNLVVAIKGVTIEGSFFTSGIVNDGNLLLSDSIVSNSGFAGISNEGTLLLRNATIANNFSSVGGAGLRNGGVAVLTNTVMNGNFAFIGGGGIENSGDLVVNESRVENNTADICDSQDRGGGIWNLGLALINGSTISGNTAPIGGGIFDFGSMTLRGSTVTNNTAEQGCAGEPLGGGIVFSGKLTLLGTTVMCNNKVSADGTSSDDIDNFNGAGTLTQFGSRIGGCPATATAAAAAAPHARQAALFRLDKALWAAALRPPAVTAHESRGLRNAVRLRVRVLRQAAQRLQRLLAPAMTG